ncbi:hypothetical protein [Alistipes onderdonkii]|uniref:hypothetical protein n=1 Tax=Alistipes onderdonkii TaxID=328813 RepID=UPI0018734339|nr:hypothetical protein [Alistipes onderdonkii]MBE5048014.1 hypothetical protein [Alistipes onderdonkii]
MQKIMFNDRYGLTDAVIEGRQTMTRRLVSDRLWEIWTDYDDFCNSVIGGIARGGTSVSREYYHECDFFKDKCRYKVGEVVAVAQSYEQVYLHGNMDADDAIIRGLKYDPGMCNKMYVRAALMPHQIRITGIRCERLQDISDEDCFREGIIESWYESTDTTTYGYADEKKGTAVEFDTPRKAFASLIDRVSGKGTWASNPWVVVYEFELVK